MHYRYVIAYLFNRLFPLTMRTDKQLTNTRLDRLAVLLSGLCLLHCLALPLLLAGLPVLGGLGGEHFHVQMLAVVLPVSVVAFALGHRSLRIIGLGAIGLSLLVVGGTIVHAGFGAFADTVFTVAGALILACAHFFNGRPAAGVFRGEAYEPV